MGATDGSDDYKPPYNSKKDADSEKRKLVRSHVRANSMKNDKEPDEKGGKVNNVDTIDELENIINNAGITWQDYSRINPGNSINKYAESINIKPATLIDAKRFRQLTSEILVDKYAIFGEMWHDSLLYHIARYSVKIDWAERFILAKNIKSEPYRKLASKYVPDISERQRNIIYTPHKKNKK